MTIPTYTGCLCCGTGGSGSSVCCPADHPVPTSLMVTLAGMFVGDDGSSSPRNGSYPFEFSGGEWKYTDPSSAMVIAMVCAGGGFFFSVSCAGVNCIGFGPHAADSCDPFLLTAVTPVNGACSECGIDATGDSAGGSSLVGNATITVSA